MTQQLNFIWRLFATALGYVVFGLGGILATLICLFILVLITDKEKRQLTIKALIHRCFHFFILFLRGLGVLSFDIQGIEKLREPGQVILANHPSLLDVVFLIAFVPRADCVVKGRLLKNPFMSWMIVGAGYIVNTYPQQVLEKAEESLAKGNSLIVFPEGTRSRAGKKMTLQRGAANIAIRTNRNIRPVIISCNPATLSKEDKWYDIPNRKFHVSLQVKGKIDISPYNEIPPAIAARDLTQHLLNFFKDELVNI